MSNAKAQHEMVGVLLDKYPDTVYGLGELAGVTFPEHDEAVPAPNAHQVRKRNPIQTDATIRMVKDGKPAYFTQVEMQRGYSWGKLTSLPAYHGSEVRNSRCGGYLFVLSPKAAVTRSFREHDALAREDLAYRVAFLSGADLAPLGAPARPFGQRALAAAVTDFENDIPVSAVRMVGELQERDEPLLADMLVRAMMEECADPVKVEEALASDLAMERLASLPSVQKLLEKAKAAAALREREAAQAAILKANVRNLREYFAAKGEALTPGAITTIDTCTDPAVVQSWLMRAFHGETAAEIFPEN